MKRSEDYSTSGISVLFMQATTWIAPSDVLRLVAANNITTAMEAITDVPVIHKSYHGPADPCIMLSFLIIRMFAFSVEKYFYLYFPLVTSSFL